MLTGSIFHILFDMIIEIAYLIIISFAITLQIEEIGRLVKYSNSVESKMPHIPNIHFCVFISHFKICSCHDKQFSVLKQINIALYPTQNHHLFY